MSEKSERKKVLRLKPLCLAHGISSAELAAAVTALGTRMCRSAICGVWRGETTVRAVKKENIIKALLAKNVPDAENAFDVVDEIEETARLEERKIKEKEVSLDEKFLNMGVQMVRRNVRKHFGLSADPFQPRRDDKPFQSLAFSSAREAVEDAIEGRAFLAISGPTGCGKSVLWTWLNRRLNQDPNSRVVTLRRFDKERILTGDIYRAILADLAGEEPKGGSNERNHRRVEGLLVDNANDGVNVIILVNEAHDLSVQALIMLKRLWETFNDYPALGYQRAATVLLLGQERLESMLRQNLPELREVSQRADLEVYGALAPEEVGLYLEHRFSRENGAFDRVFDKGAIEFIATRGLQLTPQILNVMASRSMHAAHLVGADQVTAEHVGRLLQ